MPAADVPARRPIFLAGAPGSGTTLLRLMLDSHEHIAIPQETGFLRLAMAHQWVPFWDLGDRWNGHLDVTDSELAGALAEFYGGMFERYAAARGKQRWGDKTPFHVWHLQLALRLFPEAQVVGIVRHPGAVVSSLRRRFRRPVPKATRVWKRSTRRLLWEAAQLGDRCVVLRYEDLVRSPEPTMRALLEWLGEPWSDRVLAHHEVQQEAGAAREAEGFTRTDAPISTEHLSGWEDHLRADERELVARRTAALAGFLGYDLARGAPGEAFGTGAFLTGQEVRERQQARPGPIDWSRAPRPKREDRPLRPPPPRPRRKSRTASLTVRQALRQRLRREAKRRLSPQTRKRLNAVIRNRPTLDHMVGPRGR